MDHIKISQDKLKLMLSDADLAHYKLNMRELEGEGTLSRKTFRDLFADIKRNIGFDAADDKVFIQLYPSRDGGAELYITRLSHDEKRSCMDGNAHISISTVFAFCSMRMLLKACTHLLELEGQSCSSAWQEEGKYYLILEEKIACIDYLRGNRPTERHRIIGDYGKIYTDPTMIHYVKEHCLCFCEKNAVKILSSMV